MREIFKKIENNYSLTQQDVLELLRIDVNSEIFLTLLDISNQLSIKKYNKNYLFTQIGINSSPCFGKCNFCNFSENGFNIENSFLKTLTQIKENVKNIVSNDIDAIFLMTTANFDKEQFLNIGKEVKLLLPNHIGLVANIGDFNLEYAKKMKEVGFNAVYHVCRLREGVDTNINKEIRLATIDAIKAVNLDLYYCIEPIGVEHTYEEILEEMMRAKKYLVDVMAVMRRVNLPNTIYSNTKEISDLELLKIAAVTRIFVDPKISMCIHEPITRFYEVGVNQLYAEYGTNPRDNNNETSECRGFNIDEIKEMFKYKSK